MVNAASKDFLLLFQNKNDYVLTKFLFLQSLSFSLQRPNVDKFEEGYLSQKKRGEYVIPLLHMAQDPPHQ